MSAHAAVTRGARHRASAGSASAAQTRQGNAKDGKYASRSPKIVPMGKSTFAVTAKAMGNTAAASATVGARRRRSHTGEMTASAVPPATAHRTGEPIGATGIWLYE